MSIEIDTIKANRNSACNTVPALTKSTFEVLNMANASLPFSNNPNKICSVCDCDKKAMGRGWCSMHYKRWRIHGNVHYIGEKLSGAKHPRYKHGGYLKKHATPEYSAWSAIKRRCYNPKQNRWKYYGGRGIKVCDRWLNSFENFLADMGKKTTPKHTIERINNDGNYSPDNCKWALPAEQRRNTRKLRPLTARGQTLLIREWAKTSGVDGMKESTIGKRLRRGWSIEDAIFTPVKDNGYKPETRLEVNTEIALAE